MVLAAIRALIVSTPLPAAMTTAALATVMIRPVRDEAMAVNAREQLVVRAARNDQRTQGQDEEEELELHGREKMWAARLKLPESGVVAAATVSFRATPFAECAGRATQWARVWALARRVSSSDRSRCMNKKRLNSWSQPFAAARQDLAPLARRG
jgi:hypothetical protein